MRLVLAFVMLLGGWRAPGVVWAQATAQVTTFTVQVAAFQSQESAEILVSGLRARKLDAYWVKADVPGQGVRYRVRLGKFVSSSQAQAYGRKLRQSGLLDAYLVLAYDPPSKIETRPPSPVIASAPQAPPADVSQSTQSSASSSIPSSVRSSPLGQAEREAIILIASRQWAAPTPLNMMARSSATSALGVAESPSATPPKPPPALLTPPPAANASSAMIVPVATSSSVLSSAISRQPVTPPPSVIGAAVSVTPHEVNPAISRAPASGAAAPVAATTEPPPPSTLGSEALDLGRPILRGLVESRDGQLLLVVQNLDVQRPFKGTARVAVADAQRQSDTTPVSLALRPNEERVFPLETAVVNGTYTMTIFDETGAVRIIRGAAIGAGMPAPKASEPTSLPIPDNDITIVPRQIASTSENVTLEFEITSQRPLGYVSLTLRAGNLTDIKRAVLTGNQGRIPFLVPVRTTETAFTFELKDESDRVLIIGEDDLRRIVR
jgi:hypothetical protein